MTRKPKFIQEFEINMANRIFLLAAFAFSQLFCLPTEAQPPVRGNEGGIDANPDLALIDDVEQGFQPLFDGKTLNGWEQKNGFATFEVVDGTILGRTAKGSPNSFLCTVDEFADFDLRFQVKVDPGLNSGVQIRSQSKPGFKSGRVHGPQVEIESDPGESGYIYSEGTGRKWISPTQKQKMAFNNDDWNDYRILADGPRVRTWINGVPIEDIEIPEVEPSSGFIGLQVHGVKDRGPFKVQWRKIRIKELDGTERRHEYALRGTPVIDGKIDDVWQQVPRLVTSREIVEHTQLAEDQRLSAAHVKCMWDENYLYCLAVVSDESIHTDGSEPWEQDSVEFFVDPNLSRGETYDDDDAQYRTGADGRETGGASTRMENYTSKVSRTETGYIVEARIKLDTAAGKKIGFDVQVNNDADGNGVRQSTMKWNDWTDETYHDASRMGTLELIDPKE